MLALREASKSYDAAHGGRGRAPATCSTSTVACRRRIRAKSCVVHTTATSVFVGRQAELGVLHDAFDDASAGQPQVVVVEGEAGIGKTTLVERFLSDLPAARLLKASGDESESHVPFAMADQLLRAEGSASDALGSGRHVAIGLELLELISSDPREGPCVVFVDDAHSSTPNRCAPCSSPPAGWWPVAPWSCWSCVAPPRRHFHRVGASSHRGRPAACCRSGRSRRRTSRRWAPRSGVDMTPEAAGRLWEHTGATRSTLGPSCASSPRTPGGSTSTGPCRCRSRTRSSSASASIAVPPMSSAWSRRPRSSACGRRCTRWSSSPPSSARWRCSTTRSQSGLVRLDDRGAGRFVEFSHPLARAAIYDAPAHRATQRAQRRGGGDRRRPGRGDAPSRGGRDGRRRRAARRPRSACARRDVARRLVERRVEPDRGEPAEPGPGRARATRAGGDRGHDVLRRRGRGAAARRPGRFRRRPPA